MNLYFELEFLHTRSGVLQLRNNAVKEDCCTTLFLEVEAFQRHFLLKWNEEIVHDQVTSRLRQHVSIWNHQGFFHDEAQTLESMLACQEWNLSILLSYVRTLLRVIYKKKRK